MSGHGIRTYRGGEAKPAGQPMWMSHWIRTSCNSALQVDGHISIHDRSTEKDLHSARELMVVQVAEPSNHTRLSINAPPCDVSECRDSWRHRSGDIVVYNSPQSAKVVGAVAEARRVEIRSETPATNSKSSRISISELHPYEIFNLSQNAKSSLTQKSRLLVNGVHASKAQTDDRSGASIMESNDSQMEGRPQSQQQSVKPCSFLPRKTLPVPRLFSDRHGRSTSNSVPYRIQSRGNEMQSICRREETEQSFSQVASERQFRSREFIYLEGEDSSYQRNPTLLVCDQKIDNQLVSRNFGLISSKSYPVGLSRLEERSQECPKRLCSVSDVEKMEVSAAVNPLEGISGVPPKFSYLTEMLFKKTPKGGHTFKESTNLTKFSRSASHEPFTLLPGFEGQDNYGVKLQPLKGSTSSEGREDVGGNTDFLGWNNESCAETDAMDANFGQTWKSLHSITSSVSNKDAILDRTWALCPPTISLWKEKSRSRMMEANTRDSNLEPSFSFAAKENTDLSASKTESLDMERLFHAEEARNSVLSLQQYSSVGEESSSRGVKRPRPSIFYSDAIGTKSTRIGDSLSSDKVNKLYSKFMDYSKTSSGPALGKLLSKGKMQMEETILLRNNKSSSISSLKERSWIKRWFHNKAPTPVFKPVATMACEPESSKMAADEFQRKQFPSIGAMALLGKAMKGFQPCEFQKRGSFVVWNTG